MSDFWLFAAITENLWFTAIFTLIIVSVVWSAWERLGKEEKNYDWYRKQHPGAFRNGRILCHRCGNDRIAIRALLRQNYLREHVCSNCGTTLFYSPERGV
jgi:cbb3-type cytochrome oxidase subunit 3